MMLLVDNYDSFTYNLAHLFGALGVDVRVVRNDEITADEAEELGASQLVVSPGPGGARGAGVRVAQNDETPGGGGGGGGAPPLAPPPAPARPADAGVSIDVIRRLAPKIPTLGVCLGHQAIVEAFGGEVGYARE